MKSLIALLAFSLMGSASFAQQTASGSTSAKASDLKKSDEQIKEDPEQQITNSRLRAEAGSKSKFSVKASLNYYGGSLEKPLDKERPNYSAGSKSNVETDTRLDGTVGLAYRYSQTIALRAGTGISAIRPFHATDKEAATNSRDNGTRVFDVSTPYLEFSQTLRTGNLQHAWTATYYRATRQAMTEGSKMTGYGALSYTLVGEIGTTGLQPGATVGAYIYGYNDEAQSYDVRSNERMGRLDHEIMAAPFLEYAINDTFSLRTVARFLTFDHYRSDDQGTYKRLIYTQSAGLSIAMGKTGWIYPNVQWVPEDSRTERTNVGLATTFNVF